jgi:hypothetical protein
LRSTDHNFKEHFHTANYSCADCGLVVPYEFAYKNFNNIKNLVGPCRPKQAQTPLVPNWGDDDDAYPTQEYPEVPAQSSGCSHSWQLYKGLFEKFEYCKHCDIRRQK